MTNFELVENAAQPANKQDNETTHKLLDAANGTRPDPIEEKYYKCYNDSKSTSEEVACSKLRQSAWDRQLNTAYNNYIDQDGHDPQVRTALRNAEKQWLNFRDKEFDSIDEIYNGQTDRGTMYRAFAAYADSDVVKDRAIQLQNRSDNDANGSYGERIGIPFTDEATYPDLLGEALQKADADMNGSYKALMQRLDKEGQSSLRASQREWLKFRDAEFEFIDESTDQRYKGERIEALQAKVDLVQNRAGRLYNQLHVGPEA
jgi:uncharacterized protein YecT (DUF1311 family)